MHLNTYRTNWFLSRSNFGLICKTVILLLSTSLVSGFPQTPASQLNSLSTNSQNNNTSTVQPKESPRKTSKKKTRKKRKPVSSPALSAKVVEFEPADSVSLAENIISYSKLYLGRPYRGGSKGPGSFDCSGFTHFVFKKFGFSLGASSRDQALEGTRLEPDEVKAGDLIFFKGRNSRSSRVGHVGIVIANEGNGNLKFIHSACKSGVCINELNAPYYRTRFVGCNRILKEEEKPRPDLSAFSYLSPAFPQYYLKLRTLRGPIENEFRFSR